MSASIAQVKLHPQPDGAVLQDCYTKITMLETDKEVDTDDPPAKMQRMSQDSPIIYAFSKPNQPNPSHFTKEDAQVSQKVLSELDAEEHLSVQAELQQTHPPLTIGNDGTDQQAFETSHNYLVDDLPANEACELETQAQK